MLRSHASKLSAALVDYLTDTLQVTVDVEAWSQSDSLPTFLAKRYELLETTIFGVPCLFALDSESTATPGEVAKHLQQIRHKYSSSTHPASKVAYVRGQISSRQRATLIANQIPFVVPGNQLYLPQLALDLRESFHARTVRQNEQLSPVSQAVLFHSLLRRGERATTPSRLAEALSYSAMSVGRAFEELEQLGLARIEKSGRTKKLGLQDDRRDLLQTARPYLRTPVKSTHHVLGPLTAIHAMYSGQRALAELTDLSPPAIPVHALHHADWETALQQSTITQVEAEDATAEIESWYYKPESLSGERTVDPLSLYAAYWDHQDERVAQAAEDLLELVPW